MWARERSTSVPARKCQTLIRSQWKSFYLNLIDIPPPHPPTYWFFTLFSRFNQKYEYKCVNFKSTTYPFISFRRKGNGDSNSFWPREINLQSASTEIIDEKYLKPVFAAVGGHAHSPEGVDETHSICVPYIGGAPSHYIKHSFLLIVLACGIFLI